MKKNLNESIAVQLNPAMPSPLQSGFGSFGRP